MATKKAASKKKYSATAGKSVGREMKAFKEGKLKSGPGGKGGTVKNPKQAIAIALSEARASGAKVPPPPKKTSTSKAATKKAAKKTSSS